MVSIASESEGDSVTISIEGDLNTEIAAKEFVGTVSKLVKELEPKTLIIDMSAVQLINSYGIGKVIMLNNRLLELNIEMRIKNPSKFVSDTFSMLLLDDVLKFE